MIFVVEAIDLADKSVATSAGNVTFDYLVIALGAELTPEAVPDLTEGSETFYTAAGAAHQAHLYERLKNFQGGRVAIVVAAMPYKCPAAPYEGPC